MGECYNRGLRNHIILEELVAIYGPDQDQDHDHDQDHDQDHHHQRKKAFLLSPLWRTKNGDFFSTSLIWTRRKQMLKRWRPLTCRVDWDSCQGSEQLLQNKEWYYFTTSSERLELTSTEVESAVMWQHMEETETITMGEMGVEKAVRNWGFAADEAGN